MKTAISSILIMAGIVLMAGSAGDCDGKCMDQANTLGEMMMYAFMGLTLFLTGAIIAIKQ
jgi:hypothetical protein|tara:strand:- start:128 stop:307 length:180 start_codon:yes stop_codon:yes gene_type:complete